MTRIRVTGPATKDIRFILLESRAHFGPAAADRYYSLILRAMQQIAAQPDGPAVQTIEKTRADIRALPLRLVQQARPRAVRRPRHLIVFRQQDGIIRVLRVLHERMDLPSHLR